MLASLLAILWVATTGAGANPASQGTTVEPVPAATVKDAPAGQSNLEAGLVSGLDEDGGETIWACFPAPEGAPATIVRFFDPVSGAWVSLPTSTVWGADGRTYRCSTLDTNGTVALQG